MRNIFIKTFGCQMNIRDSEIISGALQEAGYLLCDKADKADIIIVNTCAVRQHAEERVWSQIGAYKQGKIIGLVGCMAQNHKERAFERAPNLSFIAGPQDIHKMPEIIKKLLSSKLKAQSSELFERKIWETDSINRPEEIYHSGFREDKKHAYIVISEGCSNFCSYCVVPYVRGALRHRKVKDILCEIKEAVNQGVTSFTLLGQNVSAYGLVSRGQRTEDRGQRTEKAFIELLEDVNKIEGLKEFTFLTSHPKDTTVELFRVMAECEKLKKHLHLPLQSGSDRILKLMNRGYDKKYYLDLAKSYRKIVNGASLTTDVIVGFPTETDNDFKETYQLLKDLCFNAAFIFKYSPRPFTESAKMTDSVEKKEKESRHKAILELQRKICKK